MVSFKTAFSWERLPWAIAAALAVHVCAVAAVAWGLPFLQNGKQGRGVSNCFCLEIVYDRPDGRGAPRAKKSVKAPQKPEEIPLEKPAKTSQKPVPRLPVKLANEGSRRNTSPSGNHGQARQSYSGNAHAPYFNAPPRYPQAARRQKIQGTVRLKLLLDNSGRVDKIIALPPRVDPLLEEAAITAVRTWRFQSGAATLDVPVEFRLTKQG